LCRDGSNKEGHRLIGGKAFVSTPNLKTIPVQIVKPAFVDPKNEKLLFMTNYFQLKGMDVVQKDLAQVILKRQGR
jgi:hypothetical protein